MTKCGFCGNQAESFIQFKCDRCAERAHPVINVCFWCLTILQESTHAAFRVGSLTPPERPLEPMAVLEAVNDLLRGVS